MNKEEMRTLDEDIDIVIRKIVIIGAIVIFVGGFVLGAWIF